jgi:cell wall assembly regulator SMI1
MVGRIATPAHADDDTNDGSEERAMTGDLASRWTTWIDLLEASGFAVRAVLRPPATNAELDILEMVTGLRLTDEIRAFYHLNDGQRARPTLGMIRDGTAEPWPSAAVPTFGFYSFLDTQAAASSWTGWKDVAHDQGADGMAAMAEPVTVPEPDKVKREYWIPGWLPFTLDGGGNSLAFDLDPEPGGTVGQVIIIGSDEDDRHVLGSGIGDFLQRLIDAWRAGQYEIETDEGDDVRYYDLPLLRGRPAS